MNVVVLCVDFESFIAARVALQTCIDMMPVGGKSALEMQAAYDDFIRAHDYFVMSGHVPSLLRRQA